MDPDKLLDELIELVYQLPDSDQEQALQLLDEIAQNVTDLRSWIARGGFLPNAKTKGE